MQHKLVRTTLIAVLSVAVCFTTLAQTRSVIHVPSPERLRQHVTYLASDALEGRRTGTAGANDAAHYIAGEFSQIGLRPAFKTVAKPRNRAETRANYRQKFPYVAGVELGPNNSFGVSATENTAAFQLKSQTDWTPLGYSSTSRLENVPMVFVGYGIADSALQHNDFVPQVKGRIALAFSGTPDGNNPHGKFFRYEDPLWKAIAARNAGAKGLILIARERDFQQEPHARLRYNHGAGEVGIPVVVVSRQAAAKLFDEGKDERTVADLERFISERVAEQLKHPGQPSGLASMAGAAAFPTSDSFLTLSTDIKRNEVAAFNVVGVLDGADPVLKKEAIVIGAHYDHLGQGGEGSLAPGKTAIHYGADDNASGVAGLLELARVLSVHRPKIRRTVIFIAFSGEEEGLLGSNYYVNNPVVPLSQTIAMINMDMIGRAKDSKVVVGGVGTATEWRPMITENQGLLAEIAKEAGGTNGTAAMGTNGNGSTRRPLQLNLSEDGFGPSDHSSFYAKQIPVLFFWTGTHADYHKPSDTAEKLNYEDHARIATYVMRLVSFIDKRDQRPTYTMARSESTGRTIGFRVYLGTVPTYVENKDGLLLDGVRDDSPAAKAGLKAGDKIVRLAGRDVRNVQDYTYALSQMKAGEEYEVEIVRGAERLKLKITPAARR